MLPKTKNYLRKGGEKNRMRRRLIAGNWKMNKTHTQSEEFANKLKEKLQNPEQEVLICPPFTSLHAVKKALKDSHILVGAQNMYFEEHGSFTGEVSPLMIKEMECTHVILGHSERRSHFNETNEKVNKKVHAAIHNDLFAIVCVGETLEERDHNKAKEVVETQLKECLKEISPEHMNSLIIAYEPLWAIGTGKNATPQQAQEMHSFIRNALTNLFSGEVARSVQVLYGGSVKPDNASSLLAEQDIDGFLIGGASLEVDSFVSIVNA